MTQTPVITTDKEEIERRNKDQDDEKELTQEDIKTVMRNIGFNLDQENNMSIGNDSIARIFDDDEPSLQEVRQAFLVFDHNNNGYFDALDLQRVLKSLGLGEGVGMDECEQMIAKYDTNKDGRIDVQSLPRFWSLAFAKLIFCVCVCLLSHVRAEKRLMITGC